MDRKIILLGLLLVFLPVAYPLDEVIAGIDTNYKFTITNSSNAPLIGGNCTVDIYYPNNTIKDRDLASIEVNASEGNGVYYVTFGSTYSSNETGIYTIIGVCTSNGEIGAAGDTFAVVKNQYSFTDTMWQLALIIGMVGFTAIFFWKSQEFTRVPDPTYKKQFVKDEFINKLVTGMNLFFVFITVGLIHAVALENPSENLQNITFIPYQIMLWFLLIYLIYNAIMLSFRAVRNVVDE